MSFEQLTVRAARCDKPKCRSIRFAEDEETPPRVFRGTVIDDTDQSCVPENHPPLAWVACCRGHISGAVTGVIERYRRNGDEPAGDDEK
jgi:hypothetical protein